MTFYGRPHENLDGSVDTNHSLSPLAKAGYSDDAKNVRYTHSSTLRTMQAIFDMKLLLGDVASPGVGDLSDLFQPGYHRFLNNNFAKCVWFRTTLFVRVRAIIHASGNPDSQFFPPDQEL